MASITDRDNVEAALALGQRSTSYSVKKNLSWKMTLFLAYESIGVVFGDIGTSPLYVYATTFAGNGNGLNSNDDLIGALSLILWSLTLSPLLKYCFCVLLCDDNGEGGTFAAYGLLCRYLRIGRAGGRTADDHNISQYTLDGGERGKFAEKVKSVMEGTTWLKTTILTIVLFATCMVIGDGVLTPAQSVLSAIGGIVYPDPGITQGVVVGVSCAILALLFLGQRFGTAKIGFAFAPIVIVFLLMIAIVGIWNLARYNAWWVFKALSPHYGILFLTRNGKLGWIRLGGIFLTITGTEATYADLGHFSARAIQISFGCFVYPCLCLAYIGQAAWLTQPENAANVGGTFYLSIPQSRGIYWVIFIFATAAAGVASQAMISATFSIVRQSMALGCFPRVKVIHTSNYVKGQIYIPEINYILAILCLIVTGVLGQHGTTEIGNAYGIAVNAVMIITTCLVTIILIEVKRKPIYIWLPFFCFFFFAEAVYLSSNLYKVPHGGWVPLAFAAVFMCIMSVWRYGTNKKYQHNLEHKLSLDWVTNLLSSDRVARVPGLGLFYTELTSGVPAIFSHFIASVPAVHEVIVFVAVKHIEVPHVLPEERCVFARVGAHKARMYRCVVRYGYNDISRENVRSLADQLVESLALYIRMEDPQNWRVGGATLTETAPMLAADGQPLTFENEESKAVKEEEVQRLIGAKDSAVIHIIGRSYMKAREGLSLRSIFDKVVINFGYHFLNANTRDAVSTLGIPTENLLEVGMVVYT